MKKLKVLFSMCVIALAVTLTCGSALAGGAVVGGLALLNSVPMPSGSMFTLFNPAQLTWNAEEVRDIAEAVVESTFEDSELDAITTIVEDIVADKQIAFLGRIDKIVKKDTGCGSALTTKSIPATEKFWTPCAMKIWLEQCEDDLNESFWVWAKSNKKGVDRKDLTGSDFAEFVTELLDDAVKKDVKRIAWFGDVDAATVNDSPAGVLTDGPDTDVEDYNMCVDGFFKQLDVIVGNDADRLVDIARNAEASYALQRFTATDTTNKVIHGVFQNMTDNMDTRLAGKAGIYIACTKSVYDQYKRELKSYTAITESMMFVINGIKVVTFDGIPVIPQNDWDRIIKQDFDNGTTYYRPHRAVMTVKENLQVGYDAKSAIGDWKIYFWEKDETTNFKGGFKMDAKVMEDYLVQVAW